MKPSTLHYFYDPFCGWCYAAAPMVSAAQAIDGLTVQPHGVGMLSGDQAIDMSAQWRDFVRPHEQRITALSGQTFGAPYVDGVQMRTDIHLDSTPPIAAMLAAEQLSDQGVEMVKQLQHMYYQQGRAIAEREVLLEAAQAIGLEPKAFGDALDRLLGDRVEMHIDASNAQLRALAASGFPTFALERDGQLQVLPLGRYLGRPEKFADALTQLMSDQPAA
ncbi:DsbA family protein [Pseudomonas sp. K1(2024)]|uniref:DsbA family protein n=1 Tax=Pseudomonas boreofloridensis TaxID=3064348 RepID=A0ABV4Z9N6_9PSED|nr:DsbA family protein [Pseudomonas sp. K13]MDO7901515.1 DsbA family protein [Pseudomonas sp. K13]